LDLIRHRRLGARVKNVVAVATDQQIAASAPIQEVVPAVAIQRIAAGAAVERIGLVRSVNRVVAAQSVHGQHARQGDERFTFQTQTEVQYVGGLIATDGAATADNLLNAGRRARKVRQE